jgi:E3 ubiquitin-protein ligase BRE1
LLICWGSISANEYSLICLPDGTSSTVQDVFLSRLLQTGATESSSSYHFANEMEQHREITSEKVKRILNNILTSSSNSHCLKDGFHTALLQKLREDGKLQVLFYCV